MGVNLWDAAVTKVKRNLEPDELLVVDQELEMLKDFRSSEKLVLQRQRKLKSRS